MAYFWFLLAAVAVVYLQSRIFQRYALHKVSYERRFQRSSAVKGDVIELIEELSNPKWLPVPWLRVESLLPAQLVFKRLDNLSVSSGEHNQNHKSFFSLKPYTKITRKHRIVCARRGWYKLNTVTLTGGDLLGISSCMRQIPLEGELLVYPKPAQVPFDELPYHSWQGEQIVNRWIVRDPFLTAGVREYQPGDTFKGVNWKATARTGRLQVHQHDYTADRRLMIYVNVDLDEQMWRTVTDEELIERGIEWAAGAAEAVIGQGMDVGFGANMPLKGERDSVIAEPRGGREGLTALYELMAKLAIERTEQFHLLLEREALSSYSERDVLIISAYWNDRLERYAERIRYNGNSVTVWQLSDGEKPAERQNAERNEAMA